MTPPKGSRWARTEPASPPHRERLPECLVCQGSVRRPRDSHPRFQRGCHGRALGDWRQDPVVGGAWLPWIGNVIVMAGVPSIMQAMLDEVAPKLKIGARMLSETVRADAREGDIGMQLGEIAKANPGVAIGSYPFFDPQHGANTNVVLRASDAQKLAQAKRAVEDMLERVRRAQSG